MREYYKKVDKSFFKYGITIPKEYVKEFTSKQNNEYIMNFAKFFSNNGNLSSLELGEYTLVNKDYKFYIK